jgi:hypothetical protein
MTVKSINDLWMPAWLIGDPVEGTVKRGVGMRTRHEGRTTVGELARLIATDKRIALAFGLLDMAALGEAAVVSISSTGAGEGGLVGAVFIRLEGRRPHNRVREMKIHRHGSTTTLQATSAGSRNDGTWRSAHTTIVGYDEPSERKNRAGKDVHGIESLSALSIDLTATGPIERIMMSSGSRGSILLEERRSPVSRESTGSSEDPAWGHERIEADAIPCTEINLKARLVPAHEDVPERLAIEASMRTVFPDGQGTTMGRPYEPPGITLGTGGFRIPRTIEKHMMGFVADPVGFREAAGLGNEKTTPPFEHE